MKLYWPVRVEDGAYLNRGNLFGANIDYYKQVGLTHGHNGLDFPGPKGIPVYAVHDGWISEVTAKETGYGLRITQWWEEDGFEWDFTYGHFLSVNFPNTPWVQWSKPYFVKAGEVIGYNDSTGFSVGDHVHGTLRQYKDKKLLNRTNGHNGAIDWLPYLAHESEKPPMSNVIFVNKEGTGEYGFYVPKLSEEALKDMALNFGKTELIKADGKVDFTKAKKMTIQT